LPLVCLTNPSINCHQFSCCGYFNASDLVEIGGNFCQNSTFVNSLNATVATNFCVSPITHNVDASLNDVFSYVVFFFSMTLDALTGHLIRTTYGFMAGIIGLFLSSLCVIKVVCILSYLLLFSVLIVFAETGNRAFPEDRCKAWRQRICLRRLFIASIRVASYRYFIFTPALSSIPTPSPYRRSLARQTDTAFFLLHHVPLLIHTRYISQLHSELAPRSFPRVVVKK
jgi:hypothetical protein